MKTLYESNRREGFTLIELLTVMAIVSLLASMVTPILHSAKEKAQSAACKNNLKEINHLFFQYAGDEGGNVLMYRDYDTGLEWPHFYEQRYLNTARGTSRLFQCPAARVDYREAPPQNAYHLSSYGFAYRSLGDWDLYTSYNDDNAQITLSQIVSPAFQVVYADAHLDEENQYQIWYGSGAEHEWPDARHQKLVNAAFADGHVSGIPLETLLLPELVSTDPETIRHWKETIGGPDQ